MSPDQHLLFDEAIVRGFLDAHGIGDGDLRWSRIGDGQSNLTYLITRGDQRLVLRRGPRPPLPRSAHDMVREARVQKLLAGSGFPVPKVLAVCEDADLLGVAFYVMEFVDGEIITDSLPRAAGDGARVAESVVGTLARLHAVDVGGDDWGRIGRPEGYLERQLARFQGLWPQVSTRTLPEVDRIGAALAASLPRSGDGAVLVHGDYRLGNLLFGNDGAVAAVLDWEMATLGDPLADLGYLAATWSDESAAATVMELSPATRAAAVPGRAWLIRRYAELTGRDVGAVGWYQALALWKSAVFCEAILTRWLAGERPDDTTFAPLLVDGVPGLLSAAGEALEEHRQANPRPY